MVRLGIPERDNCYIDASRRRLSEKIQSITKSTMKKASRLKIM